MADRCWLTAMLARLSRDSSSPDVVAVPFGPLLALGRIRSFTNAPAQPARSTPMRGKELGVLSVPSLLVVELQ